MPTDSIQLQIVKNGGAPSTGVVTAAFSDSIVLGLGSTASGIKKVKYRIYEFPEGFAVPAGWTQEAANVYSVTMQNGADAPAFALPAGGIELQGKYFFDAVGNDKRVNGRVAGGLRSKARLFIPFSTAALEDLGFGETDEFDTIRKYVRALKKLIRVVNQAVLSGGGVTDHGALSGLADDDHLLYALARRPLSPYTTTANSVQLSDARAFVTTSNASPNTLTIVKQATLAWPGNDLLFGANIGAGTMTLTPDTGVTLNGITLTVPTKAWWMAKRRSSNVWDVVVLGASGSGGGAGDFVGPGSSTTGHLVSFSSTTGKAGADSGIAAADVLQRDGSVALTGDLDAGGNKVTNVDDAVGNDEVPPLGQVNSLIAAAVASAIAGAGGGGGDGFSFTWSAATTDSDPGAAGLRFDSATIGSITRLYVDLTDTGGSDLTAWLDRLDDTIGSIKGWIRVGSKSDKTKWLLFKLTGVTSASGYRKLVVTGGFGTSLPTTTAGDTFLSFESLGLAALVTDAVVDAAAAIAGTKIAPDFGSQNYGSTGYSFVGSGTKSTVGTGYRYPAALTAYFRNNANSADLRFWGIGDDDADIINFGDSFYGVEWREIASGRVVLKLCAGTKLTTLHMPAGTGSGVINLHEAATQPGSGKPSGGLIVWCGDDRLRVKCTDHPTNGAWDVTPRTSLSRYHPPEGAAETSSTSIATIQTIDTSVLPDECSGIIETIMTCADTSSFGAQRISAPFSRRAGTLQNGGTGTLSGGTQALGAASYAYSGDSLTVRVTPVDSVNYRWTSLTTITFSSHTNAE